MIGNIKVFSAMLGKYPIIKSALQTGSIMFVGDALCQGVIERKKSFDYQRSLRFGLVGLTFMGPALSIWYRFLNKRVVLKNNALTAFAKMSIDQCLFAPILIFNFMWIVGMVQGSPLREIKHKISREYVRVLKTNYTIWPAVQIVNFFYIPPVHQVLFVQSIALFWNMYLSWRTNISDSDEFVLVSIEGDEIDEVKSEFPTSNKQKELM